jgi:hypothetical protein
LDLRTEKVISRIWYASASPHHETEAHSLTHSAHSVLLSAQQLIAVDILVTQRFTLWNPSLE